MWKSMALDHGKVCHEEEFWKCGKFLGVVYQPIWRLIWIIYDLILPKYRCIQCRYFLSLYDGGLEQVPRKEFLHLHDDHLICSICRLNLLQV